MVQPRHRPTPRFSARQLRFAAAFTLVVAAAGLATAQSAEWIPADNPYQEDVAYAVGEVFEPGVAVEGVRWLSFAVASPDSADLVGDGFAETEVRVACENRRSKSAKVLVILLLEDGYGNPLERIEIRQFKVPGNRFKERTETVSLSKAVVDATQRAYIFFEVLQ